MRIMAKFGHIVMMNRKNDKSNMAPQPPKGFDITLTQLVERHELAVEQIRELGRLTTTRRSGLAHATVGQMVWYREKQVLNMLGVPIYKVSVDENVQLTGTVVGD
jgi:hypothetical protein